MSRIISLQRCQRGFTLIEAIVALVVLSISIGVLSEWLGSAQVASEKIQKNLMLEQIFDETIAHLQNTSFENEQDGEIYIGEMRVLWQATPLKNSQDEPFVRQPEWEVVLFKVELQFYYKAELVAELDTKLVKQWQIISQ
ncbi:type II secretion system protein [Agaribacter marinus]|uniref:Prepilin-type N-terminal cleavage/methylation domain-containing protein n=1 Tax=Agaribacter marinus TaxID=1431249 RepID=A0AA37SWK0_9ALTE|nr:type II secretion system protein [Agaribacter marinus]GLR70872.1 hypothetical protein GCM10007852_17800 [Agaribacter marinus]